MKFLIVARLAVVLSLFLFSVFYSSAQTDSLRKSSFLAIPSFNYAQETSVALGGSALYSYYAGKEFLTRQSNMYTGGSYTFNRQFNYYIYTTLWSAKNIYHYVLDVNFNKFPFKYYGLGNNTKAADQDKIDNLNTKITIEIERKLGKVFYAGVTSSFQHDVFRDLGAPGIYATDTNLTAKAGGKTLFTGLSAIFDTRDYATYSTKGHYLRVNLSYAPQYGPAFYHLFRYQIQSRSFFKLGSSKHCIAVNSLFNSIQGGSIPFYLTPTFGGNNIMRGYYTGRFRDENMVAAQVEYRWWPMKRFAFVPFIGTGEVFANRNFTFTELKPNYGMGVRYFFDIHSRLTLRIDYGFGAKYVGEDLIKSAIVGVSEAF